MTISTSGFPSGFRCEQGHDCGFHAKLEKTVPVSCESKKSHTDTKTNGIINRLIEEAKWAGVGAAANYFSGGSAIAGALFNPLATQVDRLLRTGIRKLPIEQGDLLSYRTIAEAVFTTFASAAVSSAVLNAIGYPVTHTAFAVNVIAELGTLAGGYAIASFLAEMAKQHDEDHRKYHENLDSVCPAEFSDEGKIDLIPLYMREKIQAHEQSQAEIEKSN